MSRRKATAYFILRVWEDEPPPLDLAVAVGEWLYNLRSALDYVIWATAAHVSGVIPPPGDGQLQYPIYDSEAAWNNNLYRLKPLADHRRSMLKTMQPFNSDLDANYLGWINRLALCRKELAKDVSLARSREILDRHLTHTHPNFTPAPRKLR